MAIDYKALLDGLKDAALGVVKTDAKDFLDQHPDAKAFLEERAKRIIELGEDYLKAGSDDERDSIKERLELAQQSIRTELAGIALDAEVQARATFANIVSTALGVLVKAIPLILAAA